MASKSKACGYGKAKKNKKDTQEEIQSGILGSVHGLLTVTDCFMLGSPERVYVHCRCACGKEIEVPYDEVCSGMCSCGCSVRYESDYSALYERMLMSSSAEASSEDRSERLSESFRLVYEELHKRGMGRNRKVRFYKTSAVNIGDVFGHLTVIGATVPRRQIQLPNGQRVQAKGHRWRVRCTCGKEFDVKEGYLLRGLAKSCGCASRSRKQKKSVTDDPESLADKNACP